MLNAGSELTATPSVTEIRTLLNDPTLFPPGVPDRRPVPALKLAQDGLFTIVKLSASPSASEAVGWKL